MLRIVFFWEAHGSWFLGSVFSSYLNIKAALVAIVFVEAVSS